MNWTRHDYAEHYWIVSGQEHAAVTFRDQYALPHDKTLFLGDLALRQSSLFAIGVFASPTQIVLGADGVVRAIRIATQPYTQDELSMLCDS